MSMWKPMTASISSGDVALDHDRRAFTPCNADPMLAHQNEYLLTLPASDLCSTFNAIFRPAIDDYNNKLLAKGERHADRYKDAGTYYNEYLASHPDAPAIREIVYAIGNHDTNPPVPLDGETEEEFEERLEQTKGVFRQIYADWRQNNPNLIPLSAVIHADEPNGTIHMHITFICAGSGYKRGLAVQPSVKKAFECMGITREWESLVDEATGETEKKPLYEVAVWKRDRALPQLVSIMEKYGFAYTEGHSKGKKHLTVSEFKTAKDMEDAEKRNREAEEKNEIERVNLNLGWEKIEEERARLAEKEAKLKEEYERKDKKREEQFWNMSMNLKKEEELKFARLDERVKKADRIMAEAEASKEENDRLNALFKEFLSKKNRRIYSHLDKYIETAMYESWPGRRCITVHDHLMSMLPQLKDGSRPDIVKEAAEVVRKIAELDQSKQKNTDGPESSGYLGLG